VPRILRLSPLVLAAALVACAQTPFAQNRGHSSLGTGIQQYREGNYKDALRNLQAALELGLADDENRILARKHLAFIHCAGGRERLCRDEFRKVLEINPKFNLSAAESGHPVWDPVFRSVKGDVQGRR
jgi:Tfp pilus assembly protein PilF